MKFSKLSQLFLVSMIGLLVATFLTACQMRFYVRDLETPFGGAGDSGIGREGGHHSFDFSDWPNGRLTAMKEKLPSGPRYATRTVFSSDRQALKIS